MGFTEVTRIVDLERRDSCWGSSYDYPRYVLLVTGESRTGYNKNPMAKNTKESKNLKTRSLDATQETKMKSALSIGLPPVVTEYQKGDISRLLAISVDNDKNHSIVGQLFSSTPKTDDNTVSCRKATNESSRLHNKKNNTHMSKVTIEMTNDMKNRLAKGLKRAREVEAEHLQRNGVIKDSGAAEECSRKKTSTEITKLEDGAENKNINKSSGRRNLNEDAKKEENRRTVFVGGIPLDTTEPQLIKFLELKPSQIQSIRFRSLPIDPKFSNNRLYGTASKQFTGTCNIKNAYICLKEEKNLKPLLAQNGRLCASNTHLRITSVSFNRDEFSTFPRRSSVFVGNLYTKTTEDDLWKAFEEKVGSVVNVRIIRDSKIYVSKGFGFVQLADRGYVKKAIKVMNGHVINGRPLNVTAALEENKAKEADTLRKNMVSRKIKEKREITWY